MVRWIGSRIGGAMMLLLALSPVNAYVFTIHASPIGEYMINIGPTLDQSSGLMLEIASAAFKKANLTVKMARSAPWRRAQSEAEAEPGGVLVLLARTPLREPHWRWLSRVYTDKLYAYTLKGNRDYKSFAEIQSQHPVVAVKLASASASLLKTLGVTTISADDMQNNFLALFNGNADVLLLQRMELYPTVNAMLNGPHRDKFRRYFANLQRVTLQELPLWMVASPLTPEKEVQQLTQALESFKKTPEYAAIIKKYEQRANILDPQGLAGN